MWQIRPPIGDHFLDPDPEELDSIHKSLYAYCYRTPLGTVEHSPDHDHSETRTRQVALILKVGDRKARFRSDLADCK